MSYKKWRQCPNCEGAGVSRSIVDTFQGDRIYGPIEPCSVCAGTGGFEITVDLSGSFLLGVAPSSGLGST